MWFQTPAVDKATEQKKIVAPVLSCRPEDRCAIDSESLANEFKKLQPPKPPANFTEAEELSKKFIDLALRGQVSESAIATYVSAGLEPGKGKSSYMFNLAAQLDKNQAAYAPLSKSLQKELSNTALSPTARGFCAYALGMMKETQALPEMQNQFSSGKLGASASRLFADGIFKLEADGGFLVDYVRKNYKGTQTDQEQFPIISGIVATIYLGESAKIKKLLSELALDKSAPEAVRRYAFKFAGTTRDEKKYGDALELGLKSEGFQAGYAAALALGQLQLSSREKTTERIIRGLYNQEVREDVKSVVLSLSDVA